MWKPVYIVFIESLSVPGKSGTIYLGFCSDDGHLGLKILHEMVFPSVG